MITERQVTRALRFAKPVLEKRYRLEKSNQVISAMEAYYPNLETGVPKLENKLNWMLLRIAVDALALYRVLPSNSSQEVKLMLVQEFVNNWMDGQFERWIARKVWATPFLHRLYRIWWFRSVDKADELDGQWFEYVKPDGDLFYGVNVTRCGIVRYLNQEGAPELTKLICNGDNHIRKYLPGNVEFVRTQVIAEGAEYCNFRYYFMNNDSTKSRMMNNNDGGTNTGQ
jgi:hypothetical protein